MSTAKEFCSVSKNVQLRNKAEAMDLLYFQILCLNWVFIGECMYVLMQRCTKSQGKGKKGQKRRQQRPNRP